ncbi:MAG: hypothetical protein K2Y56_23635 [Methylobacterium sp.]|uniref:hypothetical protein n=1 Tax=Methylobacterium sp. TaxID=409 RepID=UPI0025D2F023|nr:hypothetical protein [Methylobacterium sp.]MBX9934470.1 hypothetical protein [Methylobacterium sp.]
MSGVGQALGQTFPPIYGEPTGRMLIAIAALQSLDVISLTAKVAENKEALP